MLPKEVAFRTIRGGGSSVKEKNVRGSLGGGKVIMSFVVDGIR